METLINMLSRSDAVPRIVLTGGPGGGKTTLIEELRAEDDRWLLVPEAAPLLFRAGLDGRRKGFQQAVVMLQVALERACAEAARPGQVLLCHRGTLDPLAYWLRNGWEKDEFFDFVGMTLDEHLRRYDAVIHLQTAAIGAETFYRRWPDAHRPETPEQAAEIDRLCATAWRDHPRYAFLENWGVDWPEKSRAAQRSLVPFLDAHGPSHGERDDNAYLV